MRRGGLTLFAIAFGVLVGFVLANRWSVRGQARAGAAFAAVPGEVGGWDLTGPYDVVKDWPKPLSQLPGHFLRDSSFVALCANAGSLATAAAPAAASTKQMN